MVTMNPRMPIRVQCSRLLARVFAWGLIFLATDGRPVEIPLETLDLSQLVVGWGKPAVNRNVRGQPIQMGGRTFGRGLGVHAESLWRLELPDGPIRFTAWVGVDDLVGPGRGSVIFRVLGDGDRLVWTSPCLRSGDTPLRVELDLTGHRRIVLRVTDAGDGTTDDVANWAEPTLTVATEAVRPLSPIPDEPPQLRTPPASPAPRFHAPRVIGARAHRPFLFTLPITGEEPLTVSVASLPPGLHPNAARLRIEGRTPSNGQYTVQLSASNRHGVATGTWTLVIGDALALTPPMGWNSWNCYGPAVRQDLVEAQAVAMVTQGLVRYGWSYIVVDDMWQQAPDSDDPSVRGPGRDAQGRIQPNARFPDVVGMVRRIHDLGLRAGIYSSPGPYTCAGAVGSYGHEALDAAQFAKWGFDFLKYDWCTYSRVARGSTLQELIKPYLLMAELLRRQPRDIVYSICQYGQGNVAAWGRTAGGHLWRTTGDIEDTWESVRRIGFGQAGLELFAGPGGWNDPDMLVIGRVGWGAVQRPTRLTPNEQYTHMTLWCLLAAPLFLGCDLTALDDFTRNLITNSEVLEINQDPLGRAASRVAVRGPVQIWARPLADGSLAVGAFNLDEERQVARVEWRDLRIGGQWRVRDLWRQRDLGNFEQALEVELPRHGCELFRLWPEDATARATPARPPTTWEAEMTMQLSTPPAR